MCFCLVWLHHYAGPWNTPLGLGRWSCCHWSPLRRCSEDWGATAPAPSGCSGNHHRSLGGEKKQRERWQFVLWVGVTKWWISVRRRQAVGHRYPLGYHAMEDQLFRTFNWPKNPMQQLQENFEILLSQCRHLLLSSVVERKFTDLLLLKKKFSSYL